MILKHRQPLTMFAHRSMAGSICRRQYAALDKPRARRHTRTDSKRNVSACQLFELPFHSSPVCSTYDVHLLPL